MIPLSDDAKRLRFPLVTYLLIIANIAVFVHEINLGSALPAFIDIYALVPVRFLHGNGDLVARITPLFAHMFLHGGFLHIIGNLLFMRVFADKVEGQMGHLRFLVFYLLCGVIAALCDIFFRTHSLVPSLGASGAISGVIGAYFFLFPEAKVATFSFPFPKIIQLPAYVFMFIWFGFQLLLSYFSLGEKSGTAFAAHIGGFIAGIMLVMFFKEKKRR